MDARPIRISKYFYLIAGAVLLVVVLFILVDAHKSRQVKESLTAYMDNLRDMVFMSTYDSLKKGNMKLFKNHVEEIGTFGYVREFSLLDTQGVVHYSSDPRRVKQTDSRVVGLQHQENLIHDGFLTYYFPVETISYCSRCHADWQVGAINSYYKLTLSRQALDAVEQSTLYYHGFTAMGSSVFLGFIYLLFTLYERKKHEEQMLLSASVFGNAVEAIVITTLEGRVEKINPAFTRITGFSEADILGQDIHLLDAGEVNVAAYLDMRAQIVARGVWSGEIWNRRKDGESFPAHLSVTAVRNAQRRITHYISIFYDTSVAKATERALVEMDRMKSEFISTAAHELRTPLAAMMGYTDLLRDQEEFGGFSEDQVNEFLDEVYDRGEALSKLIDDLLDISRIESGKPIDLDLQQACLVTVLGKVLEFFRVHDPNHIFLSDLPESSDETRGRIDRYRINQVLENLLSNAAKYSPKGSEVLLTCRIQPGQWEVSVQDQGIGMTRDQVERIFDKFYRADSSDTAVSGLGLGMSIARQIVTAHGGSIRIESTKGAGTTATFTLPRLQD